MFKLCTHQLRAAVEALDVVLAGKTVVLDGQKASFMVRMPYGDEAGGVPVCMGNDPVGAYLIEFEGLKEIALDAKDEFVSIKPKGKKHVIAPYVPAQAYDPWPKLSDLDMREIDRLVASNLLKTVEGAGLFFAAAKEQAVVVSPKGSATFMFPAKSLL